MRVAKIRGGVCWIKTDEEYVKQEMRKRLTFERFDYVSQGTTKFRCLSEKDDVFVVPRCFTLKNPDLMIETENVSSDGDMLSYDGEIILNKQLGWKGVDQDKWVSTLVSESNRNGIGGYGVAPCGTGKTLMGLELVRRLGRKALIVVSRNFQIKQWCAEARKSFSTLKGGWELGVYQGETREIKDCTVGMINTLLLEENPRVFDQFGVVIFDECQHTPASMWMRILRRLKAKKIFGFTASFHRTDKMDVLFDILVGDVLCSMELPRTMKTRVVQYVLPFIFSSDKTKGEASNRMVVASRLKTNAARNTFLAYIIKEIYNTTSRNIFVFSDIIDHLRILSDLIKTSIKDFGFYIGGETQKSLDEALNKRITFVTYAMASEGLDAPHKDTAICATPPPSNLKQLKGRIERECEGKMQPLVIDLVDTYWGVLQKKAQSRKWKWIGENAIFETQIVGKRNAKVSVEEKS